VPVIVIRVQNIYMRIGLLILLLSHAAAAQFTYVFDQSVPVSLTNDVSISLPWAGGLNASQFNTMDLNEDGKEDLVIYDRMSSRVITFLNISNTYLYAPEYENLFPSEIESWLLLRDYNGDGRKDIFTGDNLGMKVYENITTEANLLKWKHVLFFTGFPGPKSTVVLTKGISFKINIQLNYDDLPSITDADGDGDLDIFNAGFSNSSRIEYHKNLSIERYGNLDSLDFERITQYWGGVENCSCNEFSFNNEPCNNEGGKVSHAGGKSLLALDVDNDGDQDMLFSESECAQLILLRNDGTNEAPQVTTSSFFPINFPAGLILYPAAYYEDVDFDDKKDLIVSPNIFTREFLITDLLQSTWFYKNTGTTNQPVFNAPNQRFLQENMIEVGENSAPAFFDSDGDGDLDLFIGTYANNFSGSIFYFENIGTSSQPQFKLITEDFLGLSFSGLINIRPTFADMNGDSKWDLVFTATDRFNGSTQLFYFPNSRYIGAEFTADVVRTGFFTFQYEPVTVADINLDGKIDLLIGRQNGSLEYWKNTGSATIPAWTIEDESYLGIGPNFLKQYPAAIIADLNADKKPDLLYGDLKGMLTVIDNYREANETSDKEPLVIFNAMLNDYELHNFGGRAWPFVANIFRTDKPAIIVGNSLGGLHLLKPAEKELLPKGPIIDLFPNPIITNQLNILNIRVDTPAALKVVSGMGQEISQTIYLQAFQEYQYILPPMSKGVYLFQFVINGKSYVRKVLKY